MPATATQIATFKRLARKAHGMWNDRKYGEADTKAEIVFNDKIIQIEASLDAIEAEMTQEQVAAVEDWAYDNNLYGVLGTC